MGDETHNEDDELIETALEEWAYMPTDEEVDQMIWQTDGSSEIEDELFNSFILAHNDNDPGSRRRVISDS